MEPSWCLLVSALLGVSEEGSDSMLLFGLIYMLVSSVDHR